MNASNPNPDPLEEYLKTARWPEPSSLVRNRLEARWESLAHERARSRRRLARWALAASVVLAAGIGWGGWRLLNRGQSDGPPPAPDRIPSQMADQSETRPIRPAERVVRPPTRYEQLAFEVMVQRQKQSRVRQNPQPLIEALHTVLEQPEADVAELCQPLQRERSAYENLILSSIGRWNLDEQIAGLRILKELGSPRAILVLEPLSRDPEFRNHAWPVALHLAPAKLLARWAKTGRPEEQKDALGQLLARREDNQALGEFLRLVAHPDVRAPALEIVEADADPPVMALFAFLQQGTKDQRHAAGLVLGRIATPEITKHLLAIAKQQSFPPEVMTAILNTSDEQAAEFLVRATQIPQARSAVQLACLEWEIISYKATFPQSLEIH